jgi:long-chain acyl-CoA synthetase
MLVFLLGIVVRSHGANQRNLRGTVTTPSHKKPDNRTVRWNATTPEFRGGGLAITLCEAFQNTAATYAERVALRTPGDTVSLTWGQYAERVERIAAGLARLGVRRGDTVALMLVNRPEFNLCDTAALHLGATPFSIYNTSSPEQIAYLFGNAANQVVITEEQFVPQLRRVADQTEVRRIICVDGTPDGTIALSEVEGQPADGFDFAASWRAVTPEDVATIIYTSGTTGPPKGVEITHANMLAQCAATSGMLGRTDTDRVISYLPSAHVADRWGTHYSPMVYGTQVTCLADHRTILAAFHEVRPTTVGGVPQMWYKLKAGIEAAVEHEPDPAKQQAMRWAIDTGRRYVRAGQAGEIPPELAAEYRKADELVLAKLRAMIGLDQTRIAVSGAAPIAPDVLEFVCGIGLPVCELWGMSELSCCATINPPDAIRIGTVGVAITGVELRLDEDGELLVRGPIVMRGYRRDPEKTAATIDQDGWLHTGDIATIDEDGYVTIVDRKKELIINIAGKNMSPSNIESAVRAASALVGQAVTIGDNRPYNTALIVLEPDMAAGFATAQGKSGASIAELAKDPAMIAAIQSAVDDANTRLSRVEQIKKFRILPTVWEPGGDELTPTMKLRRRPITEKYAAEIEALYS